MQLKRLIKKIIGTELEWNSHYSNIIDLINENLQGYRFNSLLDVGCGSGSRGTKIAKYLKVKQGNIYGIELEPNHLNGNDKQSNWAVVDLEQGFIPFQESSFDIVICNQILEHLKNYQDVIDEVVRVTREDGFIIIGIPNLAHLINRLLLLFGKQPMCIDLTSSHVRGFTHSAFLSMLEELKCVKVCGSTGAKLMYPFPACIANHLSKCCMGLTAYTCYLLRKKKRDDFI